MSKLISILNARFLDPIFSPLLPLLARLVFASTLLLFFWKSAATKFDGLFTLSSGAYVQIFPRTFEAVGYDSSQLSIIHKLIALGGSYAEWILPFLIIVGLFTRLSSLAMIGFIIVLSVVDIYGHHATTGAFFDKDPAGLIFDQRAFWIFLLLVLVAKGGGFLSLDRIFSSAGRPKM